MSPDDRAHSFRCSDYTGLRCRSKFDFVLSVTLRYLKLRNDTFRDKISAMMQPFSFYRLVVICLVTLLSACGGGSDEPQDTIVLSDEFYSLSGSANVLPGPVTLSSKYVEELNDTLSNGELAFVTVAEDQAEVFVESEGLFRFSKGYQSGEKVLVEVSSAPENYACFVDNPLVTFVNENVSDLLLSCQRDAFSVSGTVLGLRAI